MKDGTGALERRKIGRRRFLKGTGLLGAGILLAVACRGSRKSALTTIDRTLRLDAGGSLVYASGQPYVVRTDLAEAPRGREHQRRSLLVSHHCRDSRLV